MARVLLGLGLGLALLGCGSGEVTDVAEPEVIDFQAAVQVSPDQPMPGRRVSFTLEVTSGCNHARATDVVLRVMSQDGTRVMYEQVWDQVEFEPTEVWNLTQGFVADSDPGKTPWKVRIVVKDHDTGIVLHEQDAAFLKFAS